MIASLRGTITKVQPGQIAIDVNGVGYAVAVPLSTWEKLKDKKEASLHIATYVREDRFELYGFADRTGKVLFERLLDTPGIGPRMGLELGSVPKDLLVQAIAHKDDELLTNVKGVGKKMAEKLLVDLKNLMEKQPDLFKLTKGQSAPSNQYDQEAIEALKNLGYDHATIMHALKDLPADLQSTEERVTAALRAL